MSMKHPTQSFLFSLGFVMTLAGCGRAEFGVFGPESERSTSSPQKLSVGSTGSTTDSFDVTNKAKQVDVLFVMDNSGSMAEEQASVVDSFASFLEGFTKEKIDYQIGVVSTDNITKSQAWWKASRYAKFPNVGPGSLLAFKGNSRFIKSTEGRSEALRSFRQNITLGTEGSGSEAGTLSVVRALSPRMSEGEGFNNGFLRSDAMLSVILVSDEDESVGNGDARYVRNFPDLEANRVNTFINTLKAAKPNRPDRIRLDLVINPVDQRCRTALEKGVTYTKAFRKLYEGAEPSGKILNICNEFSKDLGDIGSQIAVQVERRFKLKAKVEGNLKVKLNGEEIKVSETAGYTLNVATNEVQINGLGLEEMASFKVEASYSVKK